MVKLWISDKLELRWNEWPEKPLISAAHIYEDQIEAYDKALAKAKAESLVVYDQDGFACVNNGGKPDSFVDFPIQVEVVHQWKHTGVGGTGEWRTDTENACWTMANGGMDTRQVARLKPVNSAHGYSEGAEFSSDSTKVFPADSDPGVGQYYENAHSNETLPEYINRCERELAVEKYFGLNPGYREKATIPGADYGQIVNLLAMFKEEQLAASNKHIKELEQWKNEQLFVWGPIFAYCDDETNAKRLGIGLGQSISARILEILKEYK